MQQNNIKASDWLLLFIMGGIWGSSFVLMKIASRSLTAYEIAALRMASAGLILLPYFPRIASTIDKKLWKWVFLVALFGSGIPSILFATAAPKIDSNISGVINSLTPIFTFIVSASLFKNKISTKGKIGIIIGFIGVMLLFVQKKIDWGNSWYALLPILATMCYGVNINLVKEKLGHLKPRHILVIVFSVLSMCGFVYLIFFTDVLSFSMTKESLYFWKPSDIASLQKSRAIIAICILGLIGSTFASLLFYYLLRNTNAVFASMNTYLIPITAIIWGHLDGEEISSVHGLSLIVILIGVYLVSEKKLRVWKKTKPQ